MWSTANYWFDVSVVVGVLAIGNILPGHFEEHLPKWKRLFKLLVFLIFAVSLSYFNQRWLFYSILLLFALVAVYIHVVWLPKNGINGWTGEPKEKYLDWVKGKKAADLPHGFFSSSGLGWGTQARIWCRGRLRFAR